MVERLLVIRYARNFSGGRFPHSAILLNDRGDTPEIISNEDEDVSFPVEELSVGIIAALTKLKVKLRELGYSVTAFVIPQEPEVKRAPEPKPFAFVPFDIVNHEANNRYFMMISEQMDAALRKVGYADFIYGGYGNADCAYFVRLNCYKILAWDRKDIVSRLRRVKLEELTFTDRAAYNELLNRLQALGFSKDTPRIAAKHQSFTEALYQDRKEAAVKAAQPVIAKDLEVNAVVSNFLTKGDDKMFRDRYMRACAILTRCREMNEHFVWLFKHGGLDIEHDAALKELHKAVTKFYKRGVNTC
jgi:hypothetical protein